MAGSTWACPGRCSPSAVPRTAIAGGLCWPRALGSWASLSQGGLLAAASGRFQGARPPHRVSLQLGDVHLFPEQVCHVLSLPLALSNKKGVALPPQSPLVSSCTLASVTAPLHPLPSDLNALPFGGPPPWALPAGVLVWEGTLSGTGSAQLQTSWAPSPQWDRVPLTS